MSEIKERLSGNVVCYGRVSTKHDEQVESLENQKALFKGFLEKNSDLVNVETFLDQESGKTSERKQYLKMIARISKGDIRYILTKNISRLSRSSEVSGSLNRMCEKYNCRIIFVGTGEVYDPKNRSDRLTNTILSAIAEDYIYNQSELGKQAHMLKCAEKRLNRQNETYGYRFNNYTNEMEIVDEEAAVVRLIFEWYVYRNMGISQISRELAAIGVVGKRSGKMLTTRTILQRLKDTAYIGKMAFNKSESHLVTGVGAKTIRTKRPKEDWVFADCPAIISEELFELAQVVRQERKHLFVKSDDSTPQARFTGTHLFSSKVFCGSCGKSFQHFYCDRSKSIGAYRDSFGRKAHLPDETCSNQSYNRIFEGQLMAVSIAAINSVIENKSEVFDNIMSVIRKVLLSSDKENDVELHKKLKKAEEEKQNWLHAYKDAVISGDSLIKEECLKCFRDASEKAEKLQQLLKVDDERKSDIAAIEERIKAIEKRVNELKRIDTLTRADVLLFIDKIVIQETGHIEIYLTMGEKFTYKVNTYADYKKENLDIQGSLFHVISFSCIEEPNEQVTERMSDEFNKKKPINVPAIAIEIVADNRYASARTVSFYMKNYTVRFNVFVNLVIR